MNLLYSGYWVALCGAFFTIAGAKRSAQRFEVRWPDLLSRPSFRAHYEIPEQVADLVRQRIGDKLFKCYEAEDLGIELAKDAAE